MRAVSVAVASQIANQMPRAADWFFMRSKKSRQATRHWPSVKQKLIGSAPEALEF
jgi:hypothetical protein